MPSPEHPEGGPSREQPALSSATPLREALQRLDTAVSSIHDSATFRQYLDAQARLHQYSWGNVLLIIAQRPDATRVAGFQTWKSLGRSVRKGERGIRILVPIWLREDGEPNE